MRSTFYRDAVWRRGGLAILAAALAATSCGDVDLSPVAPSESWRPGNVGVRTLQVTASLTAEQGACVEAQVLYDGMAVPGSTVLCPDAPGCARLDFNVRTTSTSGRHTLSLQVVRQSLDRATYVAEAHIQITRDGLPFLLPISPDPIRAALRAGERVDFELTFVDW